MNEIIYLPGGGVTSPKGFTAGATLAGIRPDTPDKPDLAILYSELPCAAAGVFTRNAFAAAPVQLCRERLAARMAQAIVVNSGSANAGTGDSGLTDAVEMTAAVAKSLGVAETEVLVASTGVIGQPLPMERIRRSLPDIVLAAEGGTDFARAIMTTDTVPKEAAVSSPSGGYIIGGAAKGAGMIHPDMATLLAFITTDAEVEPDFLQDALAEAADASFNMISVDGDTSTNDTVLLLASGAARTGIISAASPEAPGFKARLAAVCIHLAKALVRDAEGATKLFEVRVHSATDAASARMVARTITTSPLVKTAVYGADPNWGRILAAAGRCGAPVDPEKTDLSIGGLKLLAGGRPVDYDAGEVSRQLKMSEIIIDIGLNLGNATATAWGCDLTPEYISINADYTT